MENKSHALAAGAFVMAVTALLVALAMWLMRDVANTDLYEMVTDGPVTGLQPQASVQFKGVAVGKVTDISFDPDRRGNVLVRIAVSPDAPITKSTFATLTFQGVTGLSFVQLDDPGGSTEPPAPGPNGRPPRIPLKDSMLGQLTDRANHLMDKIERAADGINQALGGENQAALTAALKEIGGAAKSLNRFAANTDKTIQAQFGPNLTDVPELVRQATSTLKSLEGVGVKANAAMDEVSAAAVDLRRGIGVLTAEGGAIDRLNDSVTAVSATTLPRIQSLTDDASRALRRFGRVVERIDENPQSLIYGNSPIPPGPGEPGFTPAPFPSGVPTPSPSGGR
ncbi:MAG: MlaD family protein [Desulfovibrionaceae bacterium]|jgi:phospholipid/cholesterol/gamma-HCH transport system substrate-binding protein|nr:MlaD family protein [Desulfovibrionaceae bacterium]